MPGRRFPAAARWVTIMTASAMTASANEKTRLKELRKYRGTLEKRNQRFSELCRLVCETLDVPTAAITLLDGGTSWLVAHHGSYSRELPRAESLSAHVVDQGTTVCVPDVTALPDKRHSRAMTSCGIRSYVAVPLTVRPGVHIGTFYVSCATARQFDGRDIKIVESLGGIASSLMTMSRLKQQNATALSKMKALVSRLKAQQATLRRNSRMFRQVSHLAGIGGWEVDIASNRTFWSDEVYKIHEIDPGIEFDLSTAINFYPDEARATVLNLVNRAIAIGQPYEFELPFVTAMGNRRLVRSMGEAEYENGQVVRLFGTFQDITEQRAAEKRALQSQKMDAVGQLTGGIAHDFNNILAVIIGNLQICLKTEASHDMERERVAAALAAARRAAKITNRLLLFSRNRDAASEAIDPTTVIEDIKDMLREACGAKMRLVVRSDADRWAILSDASQLETALLNLVINARDASDGTGVIVISVEKFRTATEIDFFPARLDAGDYVKISVSDWGSGIPKAILEKVTEPFFTTKDAGKGTGLGLSMVQEFVTRSRGAMHVGSQEGVGTTMSLYLPRLQQTAINIAAASQFVSGRILVVDDDHDVRTLAVSMLERLGHSCASVADAHAALEFLQASHDVAIMFSDVRMPGGMNGLQLVQEARLMRSDLKVILTSGHVGDMKIMQQIKASRFAFLPKPYDEDELGGMIQSILRDARSAA